MPRDTLICHPIGTIRTRQKTKFDAPSQPRVDDKSHHIIELFPNMNLETALHDLSGFDRIWLIWWFHRNTSWRPKVLPPRGKTKRRGLFSTRSPHRPNPIGISAVELIEIDGLRLVVGAVDLIDGTPILDIKPYIPAFDSFSNSETGWLNELEVKTETTRKYTVTITDEAHEQVLWLDSKHNINFFHRALEVLSQDPSPHRTRRIAKAPHGGFRMACGAWRIFFHINKTEVIVTNIGPGFPQSYLLDPRYTRIPDRQAQMEFLVRFPAKTSRPE